LIFSYLSKNSFASEIHLKLRCKNTFFILLKSS
jgi:hypothetical protein